MAVILGFASTPKLDDEIVVALFDEHASGLVRAVRLMVDDVGEAEEIVQEAFTRLLTSRRRLREIDKAPAYLRSVAFNLARSRLRSRAVARRKTPLLVGPGDAESFAGRVNEPAESVAMATIEREHLAAALDELSDRQRECLVLRYYLSLSEAEIADTLGISKGSVKTHTSRGIEAMASILERTR
jgi:RNA polymerase sigma factor (sigma-70 family)